MKPTREQLEELLGMVAKTASREIDCEEFLARVGAYLEGQGAGEQPDPELLMVVQHADVCTPCREEFDALIDLHLSG